MESIKRQRGPKEAPPTSEEILTAHEAEVIFNQREQPVWDAIAAEIERETGEKIVPFSDANLASVWDANVPDLIGGSLDDGEEVPLG